MPACPFCSTSSMDIIARNEFCYAIYDKYPVARGHVLIIPYRHEPDYFSLTPEEKHGIADLAGPCKTIIAAQFSPIGYNIGINVGRSAGQSVPHCHCHIIPRYPGDSEDPRGGIRSVVRHTDG